MIHLRLIPRNQLRDTLTGEVHKRLRLDQNEFFSADKALADQPVHGIFGQRNAVLFAQHVNDIKTDIVPCSCVFLTRISESDYDEHITAYAGMPSKGIPAEFC